MIWPKVYRHATAASITALEDCESAAFGSQQANRGFRKFGRLLLAEDLLSGSLPADTERLARWSVNLMTGKPWGYWWATRLLAKTFHIRSAAAAILLKNNIRAVYPDRLLTLKVSNPTDSAGTSRLTRETRNRASVKNSDFFGVPTITGSGQVGACCYLLEELLAGHAPLESGLVTAEFARQLYGFQVLNGADHQKKHFPLETPDTCRSFRHNAASAGLDIPRPLAAFLDTVNRTELDIGPWSLCHGDLSRSNILAAGGHFAIIDWEFSESAPSASDVVRLATQFPDFAENYLLATGHRNARQWLVMGCLHAANSHMRRLSGLSENRHASKARQKAIAKFSAIMTIADLHARLELKG